MKLYKPITVFMNSIYRQILAIGTLKIVFLTGCCTICLTFIQIIVNAIGMSDGIYQAIFVPILIFVAMFFVSVFIHIDYRTKHNELKDLFH
ncbi:MAG: hypothetical protein WC849_02985 [Candidatus Paceibacterota bacterium]